MTVNEVYVKKHKTAMTFFYFVMTFFHLLHYPCFF